MLEHMRHWLGPRRPWLWILLTLLLYTLAGFLLAPWLVERQLISLSAQRADLSTTVDNIDINPYTLTFTMEGLNVADSEAAHLLSLERLFINFQLVSVVRRAWSFDEVHVISPDLTLERFSNGDTNVGKVAERWMATAQPAEEEPETSEEGGLVRLVIADLLLGSGELSLVDNVPATRFEALVDTLDFSVQNLSTLPDDTGDQDLTLAMGNGAVLNWSGTLSLYALQSEGRVTLQGAYPGLIYEYFQDQLPFEMSGGEISAELNYRAGSDADESLFADITDFQFSMADIVLTDPDAGETLASLTQINLDKGELRWPANTLNLDAVRLRGFAFYPVREQDGTINFVELFESMTSGQSESGVAGADATDTGDASEPWQISVGELALQDWLLAFNDRVPEQDVSVELDLNATLADISTVPDSQMQLDSSVAVASGGTLSLGGTLVVLPQLQFNGELALDDLELTVLQPYIEPFARVSLDRGRLGADGALTVTTDNQSYRGNATVSELALTDQIENESLFGIDSLEINGIALQQGDETRLDVDQIRLESPYVRVEIDEDGSTNIGRVLLSSDSDETVPGSDAGAGENPAAGAVAETVRETAGETAGETAPAMAIAVNSVVVNAASADFADRSLPLPFAVTMTGLGGEISSLSTQSQQPARIALEGQVGEFGMVTIGGELLPLAFFEQTQVDLVFRNVDMPTMSPYVIRFAGREIDDGSLDLDLSYRIENEQMTGDNEVVMRDLVLGDQVPYPDAADLPLGLVVALLKDRNGVINLDVPISGNVTNPEFGFGRVIGNAITSILTNIVTSPFRFLAGLVGFEGDDIEVIEFAPGRSDVSPPQREKLIRLAEALEQRPQLQLRVPPVFAQQADEQALARLLLAQRIETRLSASEASGPDDMTASARRVAALEQILIEDGLAVQSLDVLRLMHMLPATQTEPARLDELAYAAALRSRLLAQQSVAQEELEALGVQRAQQVLAVIRESRPALVSQTALADATEVVLSEQQQVGMSLEIEPGD